MAGMGPPPKPADQRARRNASVAMTKLPASGRTGAAPSWPLGADAAIEARIEVAKIVLKSATLEASDAADGRARAAAKRRVDKARVALVAAQQEKKLSGAAERKIWAEVWKTPQAVQWEKRGWLREVALYCRLSAKGEGGSLDAAKEARQWSDRLGMNDLAMLRLRWEVVEDAPQASREPTRRSKRNTAKYGDLKVVGS